MTYYNPQQQPPKPKRKKVVIGLLFLVVGICFLLCAGIVSALSPNKSAENIPTVTITDAGQGVASATRAAAPAKPTAKGLSASDLELTVKTKTKDCFGSAGCNVEYSIDAALGKDVDAQECDVTYEVHGLEDTQTGTLNVHTDGTYDQDGYQSGQTSSSSRKLTAKIVDIDCDVRR